MLGVTYLRSEPELLTILRTAELLAVSRWQVYQLMNAGRLRSVRINRRRLIARVDLDDYIERLRQESQE